MATEEAQAHASSFLAEAKQEPGDPRTSRKPFVEFAHTLSGVAEKNPDVSDAVVRLLDAVAAQEVLPDDERAARESGWPEIAGLPGGPVNLLLGVGRLNAHAALTIAQSQKSDLPSSEETARDLRKTADSLETDFVSTLVGKTAREMMADADFARQIAEAAEDLSALLQEEDMPGPLVDLLAAASASAEAKDGATSWRVSGVDAPVKLGVVVVTAVTLSCYFFFCNGK